MSADWWLLAAQLGATTGGFLLGLGIGRSRSRREADEARGREAEARRTGAAWKDAYLRLADILKTTQDEVVMWRSRYEVIRDRERRHYAILGTRKKRRMGRVQ